ncbi:MAG TPA: PQQ-binding-like beta-propeller repeat protein [Pirellulales bacterium]|nr:PQQ-binding-like beta-propeller repeat protein [Pirellulales bacterium]
MHRMVLPLVLCAAAAVSAADWPAWRGPRGNGVSTETDLPTKWSATDNVRWRVPLPEAGNSTPIVSRGRVFVTQAVGERRTLMCFEREGGKVLWQKGIETKEKEPTHGTNPYCSASPVTDGDRIIVSFASDGLYCYDFAGNELWRRTDLGRQIHIWGNGASPVIHGELCFLNFGPGETTYLLAVNKRNGKTDWRKDEDTGYGKPSADDLRGGNKENATYIGSWTTPTLMRVEGRDQLLMTWPRRLAAYDPQSGDEIWTCSGLNPLVYTSPIFEEGVVVAMGGFGGMSIAVRAGGRGDITGSRRIWHQAKTPQRIGSGVIKDGYIYVHNDPGTAECYELKTGERVWQERLSGPGSSGTNWSSVMLAGDNCYTINQGGDCFVFKAAPKFELASVNSLGEASNSSIVPSNGELFIRTHEALWCIQEKK